MICPDRCHDLLIALKTLRLYLARLQRIAKRAIGFSGMLAIPEATLPQVGPELPKTLCYRLCCDMAETEISNTRGVNEPASTR